MPKLIMLNGPPGSGKDYATKVIMDELVDEEPVHMKLSKPLKDVVSNFFGASIEQLEENKDKATDFSMTFRDAQINVYEQVAKVFGRQWLAVSLVNRIKQFDNNFIIVSDVGREEELTTLIKNFGARNILLLQIYRKGTTFAHDIRQYIDDPRIMSSLVRNDGTANFKLELMNEVYTFLDGDN